MPEDQEREPRTRKKIIEVTADFLETGKGRPPEEYLDFLLMRDVYRCTPAQLDEIDDATVTMHREFIRMERKLSFVANKRREQRDKIGATSH
jgi:hypothetical protein